MRQLVRLFSDTMKDVAEAKKHLRSLKKDFFEEAGGRKLGNNKLKHYKAAQEEDDAAYNSSQESLMADILECEQDILLLNNVKKKLQSQLAEKKG